MSVQFAKLEADFAVNAALERLHHAGMTGDALTDRCGSRPEPATLEQACTKVVLELRHRVTDGGLRHVQFARGIGQAAMFDDGEEDVKLRQREFAHGSRLSHSISFIHVLQA